MTRIEAPNVPMIVAAGITASLPPRRPTSPPSGNDPLVNFEDRQNRAGERRRPQHRPHDPAITDREPEHNSARNNNTRTAV